MNRRQILAGSIIVAGTAMTPVSIAARAYRAGLEEVK